MNAAESVREVSDVCVAALPGNADSLAAGAHPDNISSHPCIQRWLDLDQYEPIRTRQDQVASGSRWESHLVR
jgi:hypothetical protein